MKKYIIIGVFFIIILIIIALIFDWGRKDSSMSVSFEREDVIVILKPTPLSVIKNPLNFSGKARGYWFFEASFPVVIEDEKGNILGQGIAEAEDDWMTEDLVDFSGSVEFTVATGTTYGKIIFRKDNPSGLQEHDDSLELPVRF